MGRTAEYEDAMDYIKTHTKSHRVRWVDVFKDYDHHHSNRILISDFKRAVASTKVYVDERKSAALAEAFSVANGEFVDYKKFCQEVERVFGIVGGLEQQPQYEPPAPVPDNPHYSTMNRLVDEEQQTLDSALKRIRQKVMTEGMTVGLFFKGWDKTNTGFVTKSQFQRGLKEIMKKRSSASEADIELIAKAYTDNKGDVNYRLFGVDVEGEEAFRSAPSAAALGSETSALLGANSEGFADYLDCDALMDRMRDMVSMNGIALQPFFKDWDKMRTDLVGKETFLRILVVIFRKQYMDPKVMETLAGRFLVPGTNKCNYKDFIRSIDVDAAVTTGLDQSSPLKPVPSRRREQMASGRNAVVAAPGGAQLTHKIRNFIKNRRINLKPLIRDYDKYHMGFVTAAQFQRVVTAELECCNLSEIDTLIRMFAKQGKGGGNANGKVEFVDYNRFIQTVDPDYGVGRAGDDRLQATSKSSSFDAFNTAGMSTSALEDVLGKVQLRVVKRRIRLEGFLSINDTYKRGMITAAKFAAGLDQANITLSPAELSTLTAGYAHPTEPRMVAWRDFCADVAKVEVVAGLEQNPLMSGEPEALPLGLTQTARSMGVNRADNPAIGRILSQIAAEIANNRILLEPYFKCFDKLNRGKLAPSNFRRALDQVSLKCLRSVSERDMQALLADFKLPDRDEIDYSMFVSTVEPEAVTASGESGTAPVSWMDEGKTGEEKEEKDGGVDDTEELLERVKDALLARQVRVKPSLLDYDNLRKGTIPRSKFTGCLRTNFNLHDLTPQELEQIADFYAVPGERDLVHYLDFVYLIDGGNEGYQFEPSSACLPKTVRRFDVSHPVTVDKAELNKVLHPIKHHVKLRQIDLMRQFKYMDRNNLRAVTLTQFKRVLLNNNILFEQGGREDVMPILHKAYPSKHAEKIDYSKFVADVQN